MRAGCVGYHFGPEGLEVARKTVERFVARARQLYEQEPGEPIAAAHVQRWVRWAWAGYTWVCPSPPRSDAGLTRYKGTGWNERAPPAVLMITFAPQLLAARLAIASKRAGKFPQHQQR